jgi:hypothetical protein
MELVLVHIKGVHYSSQLYLAENSAVKGICELGLQFKLKAPSRTSWEELLNSEELTEEQVQSVFDHIQIILKNDQGVIDITWEEIEPLDYYEDEYEEDED